MVVSIILIVFAIAVSYYTPVKPGEHIVCFLFSTMILFLCFYLWSQVTKGKDNISDDLKSSIRKKLWTPGYKQEVISKYKSNLRKFNFGTLLGIALGILIGFWGSYFSDKIRVLSYCLGLIVFAALYIYLAKKYFKCPVCGFELDLGHFKHVDPKTDYHYLKVCPQCGAPFREIANPSVTPNTYSISKTAKYLLLIAFMLICIWCIIRFG